MGAVAAAPRFYVAPARHPGSISFAYDHHLSSATRTRPTAKTINSSQLTQPALPGSDVRPALGHGPALQNGSPGKDTIQLRPTIEASAIATAVTVRRSSSSIRLPFGHGPAAVPNNHLPLVSSSILPITKSTTLRIGHGPAIVTKSPSSHAGPATLSSTS